METPLEGGKFLNISENLSDTLKIPESQISTDGKGEAGKTFPNVSENLSDTLKIPESEIGAGAAKVKAVVPASKKKKKKIAPAMVTQPISMDEVNPSRKKPAEEEKEEKKRISREVNVRHYSRMKPFRTFPLATIFSKAKIKSPISQEIEQVSGESIKIEERKPLCKGCTSYTWLSDSPIRNPIGYFSERGFL